MAKSNYLCNKLLEHQLGKATYAMPSTFVALFTAAPTKAGGGTEVATGAYARVATPAATWGTPANGSVSNAAAIDFPKATAGYTVVAWGLYDASTGGNLLRFGSVSKTIAVNETPQFAVGSLTCTEA